MSAYADHIATLSQKTARALGECDFEALLIHAGEPITYFADDQDAPFRSTPHFAHWTPLEGPHHLLLIRVAHKPLLVRVKPDDYWYEQVALGESDWLSALEFREVSSTDAAWTELKAIMDFERTAFIGAAENEAQAQGISKEACNPQALIARLNWNRSYKSQYEIACLEVAEKRALRGHDAAREAFFAGKSELEIHHAYVTTIGCTDEELPYPTIIALNEKGATLHYQGKRPVTQGTNLLIDAGARHRGYCSDITRTWAKADCDPLFLSLLAGVERLQQELCNKVRPGLSFVELHQLAHKKIGSLLQELGVLKLSSEEAIASGLTKPFFPHGVGHFLGLQVHDVGGKEAYDGTEIPLSKDAIPLRMRRTLEEEQVFTVEPGVYFIESLLRPYRTHELADKFDWELVNRLTPFGGVRIEDNILVTSTGHRNLTREHL